MPAPENPVRPVIDSNHSITFLIFQLINGRFSLETHIIIHILHLIYKSRTALPEQGGLYWFKRRALSVKRRKNTSVSVAGHIGNKGKSVVIITFI